MHNISWLWLIVGLLAGYFAMPMLMAKVGR